jgi:hypothetical protein
MRVEISTLFHLQSARMTPVSQAYIGGGVYIQKLENEWIKQVRSQCPKVVARELLESQQPYTHRFFYEVGDAQAAIQDFFNVGRKEAQPLLKAISLSRIVKPTSIPYSNVWVKSIYEDSANAEHYSEPTIGGFSVAFGIKEDEWNTITQSDALEMAALWDSLSFFLDDKYEPTYRRIVRALKSFELAHAIYFAEMRHPILHAALESMICASHRHNKDQVTQRLSQLVPFISLQQAVDIYLLRCDLIHAAQAVFQNTPIPGVFDSSNQRRIDAVNLLHKAVRHLLLESLKDTSFADILANEDKLRQRYQVFDSKGKLI